MYLGAIKLEVFDQEALALEIYLAPCGGLTVAGYQMPIKAALAVLLLSWLGRENVMIDVWIEIGTGRDHLAITVKGKTDDLSLISKIRVCFVCGERGATISCQGLGCDCRFHLPCAMEGGCITCYFLPYRSFCWEHCPQQQELEAPENTTCLICTDPLEGRTTYGTMVCPACKHAWFHRACIQGHAMRAGTFSLQCPLCRNRKLFLTEMFRMGIRIPVRQASWEDNNAYAELYQRHGSCNARECFCPEGREEAEPDGPWQLFLCHSCTALGTHRRCSNLGNSHEATWECDSCAGLGTSSSASSELPGPSTASPAASGQSWISGTRVQQPLHHQPGSIGAGSWTCSTGDQ
ncbi:PHD finger protein 7-like [Melopsittacus undulatus]|uniref:PHD finger protein 7-like n=1 Tax=Melopsittacus undulatus TaxID=13146 RepID=UPI00146E035A|nr:PHD finger protein 7-like [Melopsittacus undulatus]